MSRSTPDEMRKRAMDLGAELVTLYLDLSAAGHPRAAGYAQSANILATYVAASISVEMEERAKAAAKAVEFAEAAARA